MRKLLYADYLITFLIIIIWSQLFIGFHIVLEFISFAVMCYLIWVKSNWLLKCPKCNEHIFNTRKGYWNTYFRGSCRYCGEKFE